MSVKKKNGFTLIEIIVALAAFMIVMLAITSILLSVINYTAINKKTFNSNSISKAVFEAVSENRPTTTTPTVLVGRYKADNIDSVEDVKNFVKNKLFNNVTRPVGVSDPSDFTQCKDSGKNYSVGIKMSWHPVGTVSGTEKGYYEIETWCWDTGKGEVSEVNRKTYVSPR